MPVQPVRFPVPSSPPMMTRRYNRFRGVDFSTDPALVDPSRSPYALNVVSDSGGYPEKRPGWTVLHTIAGGGPVNGLHFFVDATDNLIYVAHVGTALYTWDESSTEPVSVYTEMANARSVSFVYNGVLYLLDGTNYIRYNGTGSPIPVTGYIPTTVIGRAPAGGGTVLEAVNLIQPGRKNSFIGDAGTKEVAQLQISSKASANGSVSVILNGAAPVSTTITTSQSPADIAAAIAGTTGKYAGWSVTAIGDTVTFTAIDAGEKSDAQWNPNSTGLLANLITITQGRNAVAVYQLDATDLDDTPIIVVVGGVTKTLTTDYTFSKELGRVTFVAGHEPPSNNGVDNVLITFYKTVKEADGTTPVANRIKKCTIATWFGQGNDSRVFLSGNPDYPNTDWQSGLYDPTYFPDTGYTKVGADTSAIMGYLKQFNDLLVIKSDNEQDATIYKRTAELDTNGAAYFPLKQGVAGVGAVSKYAFGVLRDEPLFLAKEGVFATTVGFGDVSQQRYAQERSYFVKARLIREENLQNAAATVWNGLYVLCVNGRCYVADGKQKTGKSGTETPGYEWYYWNNIPAVCFMVYADKLYFGTADGRICRFSTLDSVYRFADNGQAITALWSTIADDDGDFMRYKTVPKKGSGVMIKPYSKSGVKVYISTDTTLEALIRTAKTDVFDFSSVDFEEFSFETQDTPAVIPLNMKIKKYKTLQFIVRNDSVNEGFGVYGIIKRYIAGGYVK